MTPTIILLHGFLGDQRDARGIVDALQLPAIALDMPGHGAQPLLRGGLPAAARDLWRRLDGLGVGRALLCGYSLGGRLALHAALQEPKRCAALVMVSASPGLRTRQERQTRAAADDQLAADLLAQDLPEFLRRWYAQPLFATLTQHPEFARILARRGQGDRQRLAAALQRLTVGRQANLWPRLRHLDVPSLWLAGACDAKYAAIAVDAAHLARGRALLLPNVGHALWSEAPVAVAHELAQLAAALSAPPHSGLS